MIDDFNDIELKKLLQQKAYNPGENPWFTKRLQNRLPEKAESNNFMSIEKWCYAIAMLLCVICWGHLSATGYFDVITLKSLIYIVALSIGSIILTIQTIRTTISL